MKTIALACVLTFSAASALAKAPAASADDVLTSSKRLLLPMIVKSYGGKCSGNLGGPVSIKADGTLNAGKFHRDLLSREVSLEVGHKVVDGIPGPVTFDARVFGEFQANLEQNSAEIITLTAGASKAECSFKRTAKPSGNQRLYPLLAPLTANVARDMGCMSRSSKPTKLKLVLSPAGLSIDGQMIDLVRHDGAEELLVHDSGLLYAFTISMDRTAISFDQSGTLKEVSAKVHGTDMTCMEGL
jgi:hypothetical protein